MITRGDDGYEYGWDADGIESVRLWKDPGTYSTTHDEASLIPRGIWQLNRTSRLGLLRGRLLDRIARVVIGLHEPESTRPDWWDEGYDRLARINGLPEPILRLLDGIARRWAALHG